VIFSSVRGELASFDSERSADLIENHLVSGGAGPGAGQSVRHAANDASITTRNLGVREGVWDVPGGRSNAEMDAELDRALYEHADMKTWKLCILETDSQYWPTHFDIRDTVAAYNHVFVETVSAMIIGVDLNYPAGGPWTLTLTFGTVPSNEMHGVARAGGGGGGGRGGGGRSRNHDGIRYVYDHILWGDVQLDAHETQTGLDVDPAETGTYLRAILSGTDETADGTDDTATIDLQATVTEVVVDENAYIVVKIDNGGTIKLTGEYTGP